MARDNQAAMSREKIVRIYSLDSRYRKSPYPAVPAEDSQNATFITGQQFMPGAKKDFYLTVDEMTGKTPLTPAKSIRFPYIISPTDKINIIHGGMFNLTTDEEGNYLYPKDAAIYKFVKLQDFVAPSKSDYRKGKHYFYIDDRELDAERNVTKMDGEFMAMSVVYNNTSTRAWRELSILLTYYIPGFKVDLKTFTSTMIKDRLLKAAKEHPQEVLKTQTETAKNELWVLKLAEEKLIQQKMDGFYDGGKFLATTPTEVFSVINRKENEMLLSRCTQALLRIEEEGEAEK